MAWPEVSRSPLLSALELVEAFGVARSWNDRDGLVRAFVEADDDARALPPAEASVAHALVHVLSLAAEALEPGDEDMAYKAAEVITDSDSLLPGSAQCDLLRELFGATAGPVNFDPGWLAWQGGTVRRIAARSWESRDFTRMPILADALEEAGCAEAAILAHCRGLGPHYRGCWVLDLLLQRPR
jgi:hypothetical protein